jgi:hypothetical protein
LVSSAIAVALLDIGQVGGGLARMPGGDNAARGRAIADVRRWSIKSGRIYASPDVDIAIVHAWTKDYRIE